MLAGCAQLSDGGLRAEKKRQHEAHCLGEHPVYFMDQNGVPAAIVVTLVGWHDDDMSATILAARYRLSTVASPDWGTVAKSRMVVYRPRGAG